MIYRFNTRRGGGPDLRRDHVELALAIKNFDARGYLTRHTMDELLCMGWGAFGLLHALQAPDFVKAAARASHAVRKMFPPNPERGSRRKHFRAAAEASPSVPAPRDTIRIRKQPRARGLLGGENR